MAKSQASWNSTPVLVLKLVVTLAPRHPPVFGTFSADQIKAILELEVQFGGTAETPKGLLVKSEILIRELKTGRARLWSVFLGLGIIFLIYF